MCFSAGQTGLDGKNTSVRLALTSSWLHKCSVLHSGAAETGMRTCGVLAPSLPDIDEAIGAVLTAELRGHAHVAMQLAIPRQLIRWSNQRRNATPICSRASCHGRELVRKLHSWQKTVKNAREMRRKTFAQPGLWQIRWYFTMWSGARCWAQ